MKNDEIVLIKDDNLPRWRMGKVERHYMGRENRVRRCLLKAVSKFW